MKIKSEEYYFVSTTSSTVLHLSSQDTASRSVCGGIANIDIVDFYNEADKSKVCKNCLKHTDAWEPVEEEQHDPNKFKVGDTVKVVRRVADHSGGWEDDWTFSMDKCVGNVFVVDGTGNSGYEFETCDYSFPSQSLELVKSAEPVEAHKPLYADRALLENAEAELEELKKERDALKRYGAEDQKTMAELKVERDQLRAEIDRHKRWKKELIDYRAVTGKHSIENIATIMKAAPPAEGLDDYAWHYDHVSDGDNYWNSSIKAWLTYQGHMTDWMTIIRKPIIEWIENPTDEMVVKAGGRVPCEVRDHEAQEWKDDTLFMVSHGKMLAFKGMDHHWKKCRVKKSDLQEKD